MRFSLAPRAGNFLKDGALYSLIGAGAGGIGAVVGVGGGVVAVPALKLSGLEQKIASASCFPMVLASASLGCYSWYLNSAEGIGPDLMTSLVLGASASIMSPLGVRLSRDMEGWVMSKALGVFMLSMGAFALYQLLGVKEPDKEKEEENAGDAVLPAAKLLDTPRFIVLSVFSVFSSHCVFEVCCRATNESLEWLL